MLTEPSASAVGVLCRRLDGIPLAIELAAARVRSLSPEDLVARLDQRFKLLTRGSRAALERHQTLRSTIDWSYDLLDPAERQALDGLSVFAGGCDLAAAEAVLADDALDEFDVVDIIGKLVDKSLVVADNTGRGVRYRLLESIRQYAAERLEATGATEPVRRRHADHYLEVAEAAGPYLRSRDQREWNGRLTREIDNLRAVLDWAVDTPSPEHALRLIAPLTVSGMTAGYAAMDWATITIAIPGADDHPLFVVVASWAAWGAVIGGDYERAETLIAVAQHAEQVFDTRHPHVERSAAILAYFRGDFEHGRVHAHAYVERARATGDRYELAESLVMLAAAEPEVAIAHARRISAHSSRRRAPVHTVDGTPRARSAAPRRGIRPDPRSWPTKRSTSALSSQTHCASRLRCSSRARSRHSVVSGLPHYTQSSTRLNAQSDSAATKASASASESRGSRCAGSRFPDPLRC